MAKKFAGGLNRSRQEAGQREAIPNVQPVRHAAMADEPSEENARGERRAGVHGQNANRPNDQKRSEDAGEENDLVAGAFGFRSEEHTSELQSRSDLVCR